MRKRIIFHTSKIFGSMMYGLVLFAIAVVVHPIIGQYTKNAVPFLPIQISDLDTSIQSDVIIEKINAFRESEGREALQYNEVLCNSANEAIEKVENDEEFGDILKACPECEHLTMLSLKGTYDEEEIAKAFIEKQKASLLTNASAICVGSKTDIVTVAIGRIQQIGADNKNANGTSANPTMRDIPDSEVIEALNQYRADHHVPQLVVNQHLCNYAQKRVQDLVAFGGLDAHAGFRKDFENNQVPKELEGYSGSGFGENLAHQYCYRGDKNVVANTGAALIEWCFDSSTMGHREAQLSPSFTAVCVRHAQHMYVVEFGE